MKHVHFRLGVACATLACAFYISPAWGQTSLPAPTPAEAKVRKALSETTEFDFTEGPLSGVVNHISQRHGVQVQLDNKALSDAGLGSDSPVTMKLRDVSLRSALKLTLGEMDLTYVIRDGYLLITSETEAEKIEEARVSPVGDLVRDDGKAGSPQRSDYQILNELITSTISPTTWPEGTGPGPIREFYPGRALIISQMQEVHEEIEELLSSLRAVRDQQFKLAVHSPPPESEKEDDNALTIKVYSLSALNRGGGMGMGGGMGGLAGDPQSASWSSRLVSLLPKFVEPESWNSNGGVGVVAAFSGSLVVKQTGALHRQVAEFLTQLLPGTRVLPRGAQVSLPPSAPRGVLRDWPSEAEPRPNKREAAIEQALAANVDAEIEEMPLSGLRDWIQRSHDIPVILDNKALVDAGLPLDLPITLRLSKAPLGESLRFVLSESELTYVVANEVLLITSNTEAETMLTTKVYPVLDLIAPAHGMRPASGYDSLFEIIRINAASSSWDETGGPGAMMAFPSCGALVVSQTTAGHEDVRRLLNALREARNQAEAKE